MNGGRVHRLHAIGTRISCYAVEPYGGQVGRLLYRPSPEFAEPPYDMVDADILEPTGYQRVMARIKLAWAEAGVPWSPPNIDALTYEACHEKTTTIPGSDTCSQRSSTFATWLCYLLPSKAVTVPQSCSRQGPSARTANSLHHVPPFHGIPQEIMMEVLEHVSSSDLRSLALASTLCNDLVGRQLWRKFVITGASTEGVAERCAALLKLPDRANRVVSLVVGPGRWKWTHDLLRQFQRIWLILPRLADLKLNNSRLGRDCEARMGCDLEPLIRGLLPHAQRFCLRSFTYHGWLWPESPLHMFLCAQPSIVELLGVDIFTTRPLPFSPRFLPSLEALNCVRVETALNFVPKRPIRSLSVSDAILHASHWTLLSEAPETHEGALTELDLSVFDRPRDQLGRFAKFSTKSEFSLCVDAAAFPVLFHLPSLRWRGFGAYRSSMNTKLTLFV